jgi:hypothetical protein
MEIVKPCIHLCPVGAALWVDLVRFVGASLGDMNNRSVV